MPAALFSAAAVLLAALVKGAISFGFPPLATPLLALVMDVKSAVAVLIIPNIVMDALQLFRLGDFAAVARRMAVLTLFGAVGTVLGTWLLVLMSPRAATFVLGDRRHSQCDGPGQEATAIFKVAHGKIVLWHQTNARGPSGPTV